jgi:hypothetical protein
MFALAACSDSTGPHTVTPAQLARHLDSLAVAGGDVPFPVSAFRTGFFSQAEAAPANGAQPVALTVTTRSGASTWHGFMIKYGPQVLGPQYDSIYFLFVYRDYTMKDVIVTQTTWYGTDPLPQIWLASDTTMASGGSGTMSMQTQSAGASCPPVVTGLKFYWAGDPKTCHLATFRASLSWTFANATGETADFATVSIASQQLNGIILQ